MDKRLKVNKGYYIYPFSVALVGVMVFLFGIYVEVSELLYFGFISVGVGISFGTVRFIISKVNVLYFNSVSVTFGGKSYSFSDIDAVEINERRSIYIVYYSIYMNGKCMFTYHEKYENAEEFNRLLKARGVKFMRWSKLIKTLDLYFLK